MKFSDLKLSTSLLLTLEAIGYDEATAVQEQVIPKVLNRHDVLVMAKTGSGKTAAFCLPIIQLLMPYSNKSTSPANHPLQVLILAPTRELTQQIAESLNSYLQMNDLRSCVVFGGVDMDGQIQELRRGVEFVVATVGRLLDHIRNKTINLDEIKFLVLDEADRMLDMGFLPELNEILKYLPKTRQNMLFSATLTNDIRTLSQKYLREPIVVNVSEDIEVGEKIVHEFCLCENTHKLEVIHNILLEKAGEQAIIFINTKRDTKIIASKLKALDISANELHGDMGQIERDKVLDSFRDKSLRVLVATDVAARGLDIPALPLVINYSPPNSAVEYVHRVGRTGRAGLSGEAITLCAHSEKNYLQDIEKLLGKKIPQKNVRVNVPTKPLSHNIKNKMVISAKTKAGEDFDQEINKIISRAQETISDNYPPLKNKNIRKIPLLLRPHL